MKIIRQDVPTQKPRDYSSVTFLDAPAVSQQEACRMYRVTMYMSCIVSICILFVYRGEVRCLADFRERSCENYTGFSAIYNMYI